MAWTSYCPWLCFLVLAVFLYLHRRKTSSRNRRLPPGPPGWPIFGNMFQLGEMPHRTLTDLRDKYGPVVWLQIGSMNTMAILSADAATVFFKHHDNTFADRTITETMRVHNYDKSSLALAPYGPYWRLMRRLVTVDMLVAKRINDTASVRRKCVKDMLTWVANEAKKSEHGSGVHVARFVFLMTFNLFGNLMLSRDLFDPDSEDGSEFFAAMIGLMEWTGHANLTDLFPWLRWLDPQGLRRKMDRDMGKALGIASRFVKDRLEQHSHNKSRDFLDVLLDFQTTHRQEALNISDKDLNIFILEMFLAGSETTSSTIEWAMTEVLCNRECLKKVKSELNSVVGRGREVEERDIEKLEYLQCVVKETLRLHPPIPLLIPRKGTEDTHFMGYYIPKDTQVFVNAWAIGRDPAAWDQPLAFNPQRFSLSKNHNIDYKGHHFELIPFGAGRRMCAGVPLAHTLLHLVLGSLVRPGGFFVWSATPIYQKLPEDVEIWNAMKKLTTAMCWEVVSISKDQVNGVGVAVYKKPTSNECYEQRSKNEPPLCPDSDDPNAAWNIQLQSCMHKAPVSSNERGSKLPELWPARLTKVPYWLLSSQVGVYGKPAPEDFTADYEHWKRVVSKSYIDGMGIKWSKVRNVMDMRAIYGGFAAALRDLNVWVMNVVSIDAPDTLPIIYERGLFGIYHDWCESFSTYPRTYDLLHADHLFSKLKKRCKLAAVVAEVDRILRPDGKLIVRDTVKIVEELESMARSMQWKVRLTYSKEKEGLLCVQKSMWRPEEQEKLEYAI